MINIVSVSTLGAWPGIEVERMYLDIVVWATNRNNIEHTRKVFGILIRTVGVRFSPPNTLFILHPLPILVAASCL